MGKSGLRSRRNELEEKFFAERDRQLIEALRQEAATKERKKALIPDLTPTAREALKSDLLSHARGVAAAAGGLLGLGSKIPKAEQAMLDELERVFG